MSAQRFNGFSLWSLGSMVSVPLGGEEGARVICHGQVAHLLVNGKQSQAGDHECPAPSSQAPTPKVSTPPSDAIGLQIHLWTYVLIRLEISWSHYLPMVILVGN